MAEQPMSLDTKNNTDEKQTPTDNAPVERNGPPPLEEEKEKPENVLITPLNQWIIEVDARVYYMHENYVLFSFDKWREAFSTEWVNDPDHKLFNNALSFKTGNYPEALAAFKESFMKDRRYRVNSCPLDIGRDRYYRIKAQVSDSLSLPFVLRISFTENQWAHGIRYFINLLNMVSPTPPPITSTLGPPRPYISVANSASSYTWQQAPHD